MVAELVGQARRRILWNEILAQGALAMSAALCAVIVLLLLGTQILDWHWLVLIPAGTLALGLWRTLRRLPSAYAVARIVDRRLHLADTISTAVFFDTDGRGRNVSPDVTRKQRAHAERLAEKVSLPEAVPFTMPRAIYAFAILFVAASSLFALRYGLDRRLDLKKPLARIIQQALGLDHQVAAAAKPPENPRKTAKLRDMQGLAVQDSQLANDGQLQGTPQEAVDATGSPDSDKGKKVPGQTKMQAKSAASDQADGEENPEETEQAAGVSTGGEDNGQQGKGQQKDGQQAADRQSPDGASGSNSSLMAKFRDAMQNLMSRMRQQPSGNAGAQGQQMSRSENGRQGKQQAGQNQSGKQGQQSGGQQSEGQEGQPGSESEAAQNATGRGTGQSGQENASKQPGSGIGRQDGDKDLKAAEQLAAMGKISEIIGKRSANLTGEVTVEVQSNSQQLQTPYSQRSATHGETAAEISRDEVPAALQSYVQQYFEQVRRKPEGPKARPGETAKP